MQDSVASTDAHAWQAWVGRSETQEDRAAAGPLQGLAALLDHETPPWRVGELPPLAHWLYFLPRDRESLLDTDGHPKRGEFLPPVTLPRRMWVGGRLRFLAPIPIDAGLVRRSTIMSVTGKSGRGGPMVFVTVRHEVSADAALAITEEQDIVYRAAAGGNVASNADRSSDAAARESGVTRTVVPDPMQLFRFSALTFNAHRIHYDRDYARQAEGYPGLVVHGPWIATLLIDHYLRRCDGRTPVAFDFRAHRPLFDTAPIDLCLAPTVHGVDLWATDGDGAAAMTATLTLPAS